MKCLKSDINLNLLVLIFVAVVMFILSSVFYHNSINDMQEEYDKKVKNLQEIEKRLTLKEEKINELLKSKDLIEKDKENLEKSYLEIVKNHQSEIGGMFCVSNNISGF
ncbi:hypothetical protein HYU50_01450 [Candidatus Woesearchaeota archaeon]|nr:hypothetical protein [Candidatus Woesearchaeota archaeon]